MTTIRHPRASAQTYQHTMIIELSGHRSCGAELEVEIKYTRTPDVPASGPTYSSGGEPACGGEVEIVEIRPFRDHRDVARVWLDAPRWLLDLIQDCMLIRVRPTGARC